MTRSKALELAIELSASAQRTGRKTLTISSSRRLIERYHVSRQTSNHARSRVFETICRRWLRGDLTQHRPSAHQVVRQAKLAAKMHAGLNNRAAKYEQHFVFHANRAEVFETGKLVEMLLLSSTACIHVLGQLEHTLELLPLSLPAACLCRREACICKPLLQRKSRTE